MDRKEAYEQIKKLNLQEECKKKYGKNFTQCSTDSLEQLIAKTLRKKEAQEKVVKSTGTSKESINTDSNVDTCSDVCTEKSKNPFNKLLKILKERHILLESDIKKILE